MGVYGIKGWVKVHSDTSPRENIVRFPSWYLISAQAGPGYRVELEGGRTQGKHVIAKLKGVDSPEHAAELRGSTISVERTELPVLPAGEYYWIDLIGFAVRDINGTSLGVVADFFETGANDVMVVRAQQAHNAEAASKSKSRNRAEILIPWVRDSVIRKVDLPEQSIVVDWDPDY